MQDAAHVAVRDRTKVPLSVCSPRAREHVVGIDSRDSSQPTTRFCGCGFEPPSLVVGRALRGAPPARSADEPDPSCCMPNRTERSLPHVLSPVEAAQEQDDDSRAPKSRAVSVFRSMRCRSQPMIPSSGRRTIDRQIGVMAAFGGRVWSGCLPAWRRVERSAVAATP